MKRASYRDAIAWIADNDHTVPAEDLHLPAIEILRTVGLVADLFGSTVEEVAAEVLLVRTKAKAEQLRAVRKLGPDGQVKEAAK